MPTNCACVRVGEQVDGWVITGSELRLFHLNIFRVLQVKCRQGKERETTVCLMQKWVTMARALTAAHPCHPLKRTPHCRRPFAYLRPPPHQGSSKDPEDHLRIIGVFSQDHLKGYIYVEAEKEPHVRHAIKGMHNVFHSQPPRLVPIREMVDSVSVTQKTTAKARARLLRCGTEGGEGGRARKPQVPRLSALAHAREPAAAWWLRV